MLLRSILTAACMVITGATASAQVVRVGDLNTRQIRALDRSRTVVFLQGGMLEEHGPYLPGSLLIRAAVRHQEAQRARHRRPK